MNEIPDRLSTQRGSKYYRGKNHDCAFENFFISLDGVELQNVTEYCISEGWLRRIVMDKDGKPVINLNRTALKTEVVRGTIKVWRGLPT